MLALKKRLGLKAKFKMFWCNENLLNTGEVSFE